MINHLNHTWGALLLPLLRQGHGPISITQGSSRISTEPQERPGKMGVREAPPYLFSPLSFRRAVNHPSFMLFCLRALRRMSWIEHDLRSERIDFTPTTVITPTHNSNQEPCYGSVVTWSQLKTEEESSVIERDRKRERERIGRKIEREKWDRRKLLGVDRVQVRDLEKKSAERKERWSRVYLR